MSEHAYTTCDRCNPSGDIKGRLPSDPGGIVMWPFEIAEQEFDWKLIDGEHVCPDCQTDEEMEVEQ